EESLYEKGDAKSLLQHGKSLLHERENSYNINQPTLHFSAETPVGWASESDVVVRFEIEVDELLRWVQNGWARVNLYDPMIEVQLFEKTFPKIIHKGRRVPAAEVKAMTN